MTFRLLMVHHNTKFGYKGLPKNIQPTENAHVAVRIVAVRSYRCSSYRCSSYRCSSHHWRHHNAFPFAGNNAPPTGLKEVSCCYRKLADVDSYVRVGRKSMVLTEAVLSCARTLHYFKTPRKPHLKKILSFISYPLGIIGQAKMTRGNVVT